MGYKKTITEIKKLEEAGCNIIRIAIPDIRSALALKVVKKQIKIPVVADVHFASRLAIAAIENNADKIRINPGNIAENDELRAVVKLAKNRGIPIRIGVNSGSVDHLTSKKNSIKEKNRTLPEKMAKKAIEYIHIFEKLNFHDMVISLKTADIRSTIDAYALIAEKTDYPLHLGLTASGPFMPALVKSSIAMGNLLMQGIGDTIRVSLTGSSLDEVIAGHEILKALKINNGVNIVSCPTCGRCKVKLAGIVKDFEKTLIVYRQMSDLKHSLNIAIMGCEVNGPGEAKEADFGIAFSGENAVVFRKGKVLKKIRAAQASEVLKKEIRKLILQEKN